MPLDTLQVMFAEQRINNLRGHIAMMFAELGDHSVVPFHEVEPQAHAVLIQGLDQARLALDHMEDALAGYKKSEEYAEVFRDCYGQDPLI